MRLRDGIGATGTTSINRDHVAADVVGEPQRHRFLEQLVAAASIYSIDLNREARAVNGRTPIYVAPHQVDVPDYAHEKGAHLVHAWLRGVDIGSAVSEHPEVRRSFEPEAVCWSQL